MDRLHLALMGLLCTAFVPAIAADAEAGRSLAQTNCSACHAIGPTGPSPLARAPTFRTLHERYPVANLEEALAEGILVGHSPMPMFVFTPPQIGDFIAYLGTPEPTP